MQPVGVPIGALFVSPGEAQRNPGTRRRNNSPSPGRGDIVSFHRTTHSVCRSNADSVGPNRSLACQPLSSPPPNLLLRPLQCLRRAIIGAQFSTLALGGRLVFFLWLAFCGTSRRRRGYGYRKHTMGELPVTFLSQPLLVDEVEVERVT